MKALYDTIGINYAKLRNPDPRIASVIDASLGNARTVVNVGAGTGSYEPLDRLVTAVEPSVEMIRKRPPSAAPAIQAYADKLPFDSHVFDAAMAVLTVHHWPDKEAGMRELKRVTKHRIVLVTYDPSSRPSLTDYFPELAALDEQQMPKISDYERWLGRIEVKPLPVPHDCTDGFLYAYWRRPQAYLDPRIRSGSSSFWAIGDVASGLERLARDLQNDEWSRRYSDLVAQNDYDAGYRVITANL